VIAVRNIIIGIVLSLATTILAAQSRESKQTISVTFAIDDVTVPCDNLKVELRVDHRFIPVKMIDSGFIVPELFKKLYDSPRSRRKNNIDVHIECSEYAFDFPGEYPIQISPGEWRLAIRYPQTWFEGIREEPVIENGTWLSVMEWEWNGCEPCLVSYFPHITPPAAEVDRLRREQPNAWGEERMTKTYALAVFNVEYQQNRDYLLSLLNICLSNPKRSALEDICDNEKLYQYLANLYWRGDTDLLGPLLQAVGETQAGVVNEAGLFYADLLNRRTVDFLRGLASLPVEKQKAVCELAGKEDLSFKSPMRERVAKQLRAIGGDSATHCLQEIEKTENWWLKKK
jgi:hypothetical protein